MYNMFKGAEALKSLDLSNFDTSNVINMAQMFYGCKSLVSLDISNFNFTGIVLQETDPSGGDNSPPAYAISPIYQMFDGLTNLKYINIFNIIDPNNVLLKTDLPNLNNLMACQNKEILEKATNKCCNFDVVALKCQEITIDSDFSSTDIIDTTEEIQETIITDIESTNIKTELDTISTTEIINTEEPSDTLINSDTDTDSQINNLLFAKKSNSGLNGGAITAIVLGVVAGVAAVITAVLLANNGNSFFYKKEHNKEMVSNSSVDHFQI